MQKTYKIALLVPSLNGGGAEKVIVNLANFLNAEGHNVCIITTRQGVYFDFINPQVEIEFLPKFTFTLLAINILKPIPQLVYLIKFLRKKQPDIMLCTLQSANILGPCARFVARVKTKVIIRESNTFHSFLTHKLSIKQRLLLYGMKLSYGLADSVIANSPYTARDVHNFLNVSEEKIQTISNPVYSPESEQLSFERTNHKWVESGEDYIVSVGRLHPQKSFETLIEALALLQSKHSIKLIILGIGGEEKNLKKLALELGISDKVDFVGFRNNPCPFIRNAKVFVLSSIWEGFGNVLVEALSVGTPIVSTDCPGGPRIILKDGKYGTLVKIKDPEAMSKAIAELLINENLYHKTMLISRAQEFSIEKIGKEYFDHFLKVLSQEQ
ncbi:MAG: glycosyltransferase [Nodularia sp. (in: Bacteria)]|nr:MAG: glycosyltransferase [Nodularia sp. (in: cyanobacteria)]